MTYDDDDDDGGGGGGGGGGVGDQTICGRMKFALVMMTIIVVH